MYAIRILAFHCWLSCLALTLPSIAQPASGAGDGVLRAGVLENNVNENGLPLLPTKRKYHSLPRRSAIINTKITRSELPSGIDSQESSRALYQAFLKMNCQEFVRLNANYYSANRNYKFLRRQIVENIPAYLYSDGRHLLAVDPNKSQAWVWESDRRNSELGYWSKLTHTKL